MRPVAALVLTALVLAPAVAGAGRPETLSGAALVFDGDTIMLSLRKIRFLGADAPEPEQPCFRDGIQWPCGLEARAALTALVEGRRVTCDLNGRHSYGRQLGRCRVGGGTGYQGDLAAWMVSQGWAVVDSRFEQTYRPQQAEAKAARRGVWSGTFQVPCEFRGSC